jgi:hypothetical protein
MGSDPYREPQSRSHLLPCLATAEGPVPGTTEHAAKRRPAPRRHARARAIVSRGSMVPDWHRVPRCQAPGLAVAAERSDHVRGQTPNLACATGSDPAWGLTPHGLTPPRAATHLAAWHRVVSAGVCGESIWAAPPVGGACALTRISLRDVVPERHGAGLGGRRRLRSRGCFPPSRGPAWPGLTDTSQGAVEQGGRARGHSMRAHSPPRDPPKGFTNDAAVTNLAIRRTAKAVHQP